jgi:hypothetical protein
LGWQETNENLPIWFLSCDGSMFDGLSRREIIGWVICLMLAVGLTVFGSAYLASSFMSADISGALPHHDGVKQSQE